MTYCGLGFETPIGSAYQFTIADLPTTGAGALFRIIPAQIPVGVCAINIYISKFSGFLVNNMVLCYTISVAAGEPFPSTQFSLPGFPVYSTDTAPLSPQNANPYDKVSEVIFAPKLTAGGSLIPGTTYYFAFCPYVVSSIVTTFSANNAQCIPQASTMIDISSSAAPTLIISYTIPEGYNSVLVTPAMSGTYDLTHTYLYSYVFIGTSPEDLVMTYDQVAFNAGTQMGPCPQLLSNIQYTGSAVKGITIGTIPQATNTGLCTLTYAQSYAGTSSTPQFVRACYFWTGGLDYDPTDSYDPDAGNSECVAFLSFPQGQISYDSTVFGYYQILPVRGAGMITGADSGQRLVNGEITYSATSAGTTLNGDTTDGTNTITSTSIVGLFQSMSVTGPGIPAGTIITAASGSTVTISNNATVTNTNVPITYGPYAVPAITPVSITTSNSVDYPNEPFVVLHGYLDTDKIQSAVYNQRIFFVNNWQQPFYTNGYILKPLMVDAYTAPAPICSAIVTFQGSLVTGGGPTNNFNTKGNYYWTNATNPFSFSQTQSSAPDINSANLTGNGPGNILGFGVFSYNEAVNSITTQLVVGLDTAIWMTPNLSQAPQETARNIGFASANCMVNTNVGAFYLGRDNLYQFNVYGLPEPKGNDVLQLLTSINKSNTTAPPIVLYTQNQIKILYHTTGVDPYNSDLDAYDSELWCDVQLERNEQTGQYQPRYVWTGPHTLNPLQGATVFPTGIYNPDSTYEGYRVGFDSQVAFLLDAPGTTGNLGNNVQRIIQFNDLYLNADDFIKLFTRIYIGGLCNLITTITITFNMTDQNGAGQGPTGPVTPYTTTMVLNPNSLNAYQLFQLQFNNRYRGRIVNQLTLTWEAGASQETIQIYEIGLLFEPTKRRML